MKLLEGKVALVTGAARGIGKAVAKCFAEQGATVVITDLTINDDAVETIKELEAFGVEVRAYASNASSFDDAHTVVKSIVDEFGRIDILVNNAGITKDGLLMKMSEADFDAVIDVNLKGTFNTIRHVSRQMLKQKEGRIVNMSSVVGIAGNAGQVNYAASKAGVIGITKSAAKELASKGITVNAIAPGYIDTDMTKVLPDKVKEEMLAQIPAKKLGAVEDIANAVEFLAKEESSYITGQVLHVNGGMYM